MFANGNLQLSQGDLNKNGELSKTVQLLKILDIDVHVTPENISANFNGSLDITVTLTAYPDSVLIVTKSHNGADVSAVFIHESGHKENAQLFDTGGTIFTRIPVYKEYQVPGFKRQFVATIPFNSSEYSAGDYEIVPYLMVTPNDVPAGLLRNFTRDYKEPSVEFLNIPVVRTGGKITVP